MYLGTWWGEPLRKQYSVFLEQEYTPDLELTGPYPEYDLSSYKQ